LGAALIAASSRPARGDAGGGLMSGSCAVTNASGRATVTVTVDNRSTGSLFNVTPSNLDGAAIGTASFFLQTSPRPLRELLAGKSTQFVWKGRFFGDGLLDLSLTVNATSADGNSQTTGVVNCTRVAVGNPDTNGPTPSPPAAVATPTNTARSDPPPSPTGAGRPTRTPIPARPTRTPRANPSATPTSDAPASTPTSAGRPTRTPIPARPTRTPIAARATRTPLDQATSTPVPARPTRTPLAQSQATRTPIPLRPTRTPNTQSRSTRTPVPPRPTRTPNVPLSTPTRLPTFDAPNRTAPPQQPTRTSIPARPTRTPIAQSQPTRTPIPPRPTRTPHDAPPPPPTATAPTPSSVGGFVADCSLRQSGDAVTVTMIVENRIGAQSLANVTASTLQLEPEGGALFFDRTGPSPTNVAQLGPGMSATFQWTGRLSPGGTMGFSAFATATALNGPVQTALTNCGLSGTNSSSFDASNFSGACNIDAQQNGTITVHVRNGSGETLSDVQAGSVSNSATGSAAVSNLRGPAPRTVSSLTTGSERDFVFGGTFLGSGQVTMRFQAGGTRSTTERVSTSVIECSASVGGSGDPLPDLTVDAQSLQDSIEIQTQDFTQSSCAVVENCVDGLGERTLLRFDTVTPNLGPGDVFLGDPVGNPEFVWSPCHMHYHFQEYADYRLLDMAGNIVARGHKQAFCLVDLWQPPGLSGDPHPQFTNCGFQGISAGWADVYSRVLDCQWIDITGVPSGQYILEVQINPAHVIQEGNYQNNVGRAEVTIP
jgi:hypothetical protein